MSRPGPRDVDTPTVSWREAGPPDGEVVAFLHGLGGTRTAWEPQLLALAGRGRRCAAWDMPGYGASAAPTGVLTFELLADAVAGWMDALGAGVADIVGLSFGAMVAQHVALRHPARVRSLTLIGSSPAFGLDGVTTAESWVEQRLHPMQHGATPATMASALLRSLMAPAVDDEVVAAAASAMARITPGALAAAVRCLVTHDLRARLGRITAPTLVMVGEHDLETPLSYAASLASAIGGARLEVVAGAGHISNLEAPAAVNDLLVDFLAG